MELLSKTTQESATPGGRGCQLEDALTGQVLQHLSSEHVDVVMDQTTGAKGNPRVHSNNRQAGSPTGLLWLTGPRPTSRCGQQLELANHCFAAITVEAGVLRIIAGH